MNGAPFWKLRPQPSTLSLTGPQPRPVLGREEAQSFWAPAVQSPEKNSSRPNFTLSTAPPNSPTPSDLPLPPPSRHLSLHRHLVVTLGSELSALASGREMERAPPAQAREIPHLGERTAPLEEMKLGAGGLGRGIQQHHRPGIRAEQCPTEPLCYQHHCRGQEVPSSERGRQRGRDTQGRPRTV